MITKTLQNLSKMADRILHFKVSVSSTFLLHFNKTTVCSKGFNYAGAGSVVLS